MVEICKVKIPCLVLLINGWILVDEYWSIFHWFWKWRRWFLVHRAYQVVISAPYWESGAPEVCGLAVSEERHLCPEATATRKAHGSHVASTRWATSISTTEGFWHLALVFTFRVFFSKEALHPVFFSSTLIYVKGAVREIEGETETSSI